MRSAHSGSSRRLNSAATGSTWAGVSWLSNFCHCFSAAGASPAALYTPPRATPMVASSGCSFTAFLASFSASLWRFKACSEARYTGNTEALVCSAGESFSNRKTTLSCSPRWA
ncbi:hypothetical protein ACFQT0_03745 [Hymenobacter humi]|uniref:Secreted protein n=1 Tax=Hymenobacter humi TaxID=1411620 RepID=A0ABW2U020_9BACT